MKTAREPYVPDPEWVDRFQATRLASMRLDVDNYVLRPPHPAPPPTDLCFVTALDKHGRVHNLDDQQRAAYKQWNAWYRRVQHELFEAMTFLDYFRKHREEADRDRWLELDATVNQLIAGYERITGSAMFLPKSYAWPQEDYELQMNIVDFARRTHGRWTL